MDEAEDEPVRQKLLPKSTERVASFPFLFQLYFRVDKPKWSSLSVSYMAFVFYLQKVTERGILNLFADEALLSAIPVILQKTY